MREKAVSLTDGRAKAFTDHRDLLASGIADVLVIASPNHTHVDLLPDALSSGLPILVENHSAQRFQIAKLWSNWPKGVLPRYGLRWSTDTCLR
jgi:hypothetical protein